MKLDGETAFFSSIIIFAFTALLAAFIVIPTCERDKRQRKMDCLDKGRDVLECKLLIDGVV